MRTKYDDVIRAWLDGGEYEYRVNANDRWHKSIGQPYLNPITNPEFEWRIKSEKKVLRYRVARLQENTVRNWLYFAVSDNDVNRIEKSDCFVEWATDWQEVEVER